jgi:hypothetical protein
MMGIMMDMEMFVTTVLEEQTPGNRMLIAMELGISVMTILFTVMLLQKIMSVSA